MRNTRYTCECGQSVHVARRMHHEAKHRREAMREFGAVSVGERMWHKALALRVVVVSFSDEAMRVRQASDEDSTPFRALPHEVLRLD